jgi:hypothetical protein
MKDSEFIALLNLYLDHEISSQDAVRLEAEVLSDPKRRRIYTQYCQMDKACSVLAERFTNEGAPEVKIQEKVNDWSTTFYSAGLVAAACLAIFLAIRHHDTGVQISSSPTTIAKVNPTAHQNDFQTVAYQQSNLQPVVALRDLTLTSTPVPQVTNALMSNASNDPLAWMQQVQMQQIQMQMQLQAIRQMQTPAGMNINQLRVLPVALPVELNPNYSNQPDVQVQNAAFHFQR